MTKLDFERLSPHAPALALLFPFLAPAASGQVWEVPVLADATLVPGAGFVVGTVDDLDGDGAADGLISSITVNGGRGRVFAISSADGATLLTIDGLLVGDQLGHSVVGHDDVDGDGLAEILVGAPAVSTGRAGRVSLHSGADGAPVWSVDGGSVADSFGWVVASAGDLDGDGIADVLACAPGHDSAMGASDVGLVHVLSGADGTILRTHEGSTAFGYLGASAGGLDDVDADGVSDYVLCALGEGANGTGRAVVLSGATGAEIWSVSAGPFARQYGNFFSGSAGDVDADGVEDVYVIDYINVASRGRLFVYSGVDGTVLQSIRGPEGSRWMFGRVRIGDLDADGHDDLVVCSSLNDVGGNDAGAVYFYSGADGASLGQLTADTAGANLGTDCASLGDVDGDGRPEVFVGVGSVAGSVGGAFVVPTDPMPPTVYCEGAVNSTGAGGDLTYRGSLEIARDELSLRATNLPADTLAIAFGGPTVDLAPLGDGQRCIGQPLQRLALGNADAGGVLEVPVTPPLVGPAAAVAGVPWHVQVWYRDALGSGSGLNLTSALRITLR